MSLTSIVRPHGKSSAISSTFLQSWLFAIILHVALFSCLSFAYYSAVLPVYAYMGFSDDINSIKIVEGLFLTVLLGQVVPSRISRVSDFLLLILYLAPIVPTFVYYGFSDGNRTYTYFCALSFLTIALVRGIQLPMIPKVLNGSLLAIALAIAVIASALSWLIFTGAYSHFNLNLLNVYITRSYFATLDISGGLSAYLISWGPSTATVFLMAVALSHRRFALLAVILIIQLFFFGVLNAKTILFLPLLVFASYYLVWRAAAHQILISIVIGVLFVGMALYLIFDEILFVSLSVRRIFFVPPFLNYAYFDVFSEVGHVWMTSTVVGKFFEYPFALPPPNLISQSLFGHPYMNVNTGFLGTSFMHFGFLGMVLFSALIGILLSVADALGRRSGRAVALAILIVPFQSLFMSADLTTALLTHGLLLSLILLWLFGAPSKPLRNVGQI